MRKGLAVILICLMACLLAAVLGGCVPTDSPAPGEAGGTGPEEASGAAIADTAGHPQEAYIREGLGHGLYRVPPDGLFRPDEAVTAEEFAEAVRNLAGQPDEGGEDGQSALAWLAEAGYTAPDALSAEEPVTRLEAMKILYALNGAASGQEELFTGVYDSVFVDSAAIPAEGKSALYWGFYNVLIRETEPDTVSPSGTVSRGDMAEMLVRFLRDFPDSLPET